MVNRLFLCLNLLLYPIVNFGEIKIHTEDSLAFTVFYDSSSCLSLDIDFFSKNHSKYLPRLFINNYSCSTKNIKKNSSVDPVIKQLYAYGISTFELDSFFSICNLGAYDDVKDSIVNVFKKSKSWANYLMHYPKLFHWDNVDGVLIIDVKYNETLIYNILQKNHTFEHIYSLFDSLGFNLSSLKIEDNIKQDFVVLDNVEIRKDKQFLIPIPQIQFTLRRK